MTLYKLKDSVENKITGVKPQAGYQLTDNVIDLRRRSISEVKSMGIHIPDFTLFENSNLTDLINTFSLSTGKGLLISERMFNIINTLKIPNNEYLDLKIKTSDNDHKYYWFNIQELEHDKLINFKKSSFQRIPGKKKVRIRDKEDYWIQLKKDKASYIDWTELVLNENIFEKLDIVRFGYGTISWILKDSVLDTFKNLTGIEFEQIDNIKILNA